MMVKMFLAIFSAPALGCVSQVHQANPPSRAQRLAHRLADFMDEAEVYLIRSVEGRVVRETIAARRNLQQVEATRKEETARLQFAT